MDLQREILRIGTPRCQSKWAVENVLCPRSKIDRNWGRCDGYLRAEFSICNFKPQFPETTESSWGIEAFQTNN